jgi:hypothetical protein
VDAFSVGKAYSSGLSILRTPEESPVVLNDLYNILARAFRIVLRGSPMADAATLFESTDRKDLDDLQGSLLLDLPAEPFHCMCIGSPALYLYGPGAGANHDETNLSGVELCRRSSPGACIGLVCGRHTSWSNGQSNARRSVQFTASRGERSRDSLSYQEQPLLLTPY